MRILVVIINFIFFWNCSCSQEVGLNKIVKYKFPVTIYVKDTVRIQEIYFKGNKKNYQIDYADNGWQKLDSIAFSYDSVNKHICWMEYIAEYDIGNREKRIFNGYSSKPSFGKECKNIHNTSFRDEYSLSFDYYADILLTYSNENYSQDNIIKETKGHIYSYKFNIDYSPSALTSLGIPYNELIDSLSYKNADGFLLEDNFYFRNYTVTRIYTYDEENRLKEVVVSIIDKKESTNSVHTEFYTYSSVKRQN